MKVVFRKLRTARSNGSFSLRAVGLLLPTLLLLLVAFPGTCRPWHGALGLRFDLLSSKALVVGDFFEAPPATATMGFNQARDSCKVPLVHASRAETSVTSGKTALASLSSRPEVESNKASEGNDSTDAEDNREFFRDEYCYDYVKFTHDYF